MTTSPFDGPFERLIRPIPVIAPEIAKLSGKLETRPATLELLQAWPAPAADLEPWQPDTITAPRLDALANWADSPH